MTRAFRLSLAVSLLAAMTACSGPTLVESSATAVTVRYGSLDGIDEAMQIAQRACAAHGKSARLRSAANLGLTDRYAHFDCV
jgi:hypothetical protein